MTPDPWLFGWDPTPGIVSVWAEREGRALVWRRVNDQIICEPERFRPWLYAAHLDDLSPIAEEGDAAPFSYQKLDGPPGALRYLISAQDGRALENALLSGANKRLGKPVKNLNDLDDYYQVGAVEQYLMQTGRTYFRDLPFAELHRLQFDLETTALKPEEGRIFMVALRDSRGLEQVLEAPRPQDEARLIRDLLALIKERDPDTIENHNLMGFDLPFLEGRARVHRIRLDLGRPPGPPALIRKGEGRDVRYSVAGRELLDTLDATWRVDFVVRALPSHGLKDVARFFGVAAQDRVYISGREVYETYLREPETVKQYALQDVGEVDAIARRLHTSTYALARMAPRRYERVAYAGTATGILEPMLVRAYLQAGAALPRSYEPVSSEPHAGGAVMLFATGVAERVVKADIASLYPSLIRTYGIGPACDNLGVFVHLVDRLTGQRLEHKSAAQKAEAGSLEQGEHEAMQAAMKLVINSAYGYLGAGRMAWFADKDAADEITRRGRAVLEQVCHELRLRGATLIEADTDGVYFSVPEGWDEAQERALVGEVAQTLPEGLRLEFDGRYRAMFSHEVKNYALLSYSGKLVVRGGALRSSRCEPFAEAWLQVGLRKLLEGDIEGLRQSYLGTIARLKARGFSVQEVASKAKLTKSPEKYARSGRSEAVYEAMLASGRKHWSVGERVKIYRAVGRWLVLEDEGQDQGYDVNHYVRVLRDSYAERLRKAFGPDDFETLFGLEEQPSLFGGKVEDIGSLRI
jgi:DNA polymerase elongation subunit (family B)